VSENLTIICTGDLHLGRSPSRVPADLRADSHSSRHAWRATVREAVDCDADLVIVTGDVVDEENRYFEAYGAFEDGAQRLAEADIPLVAVSGSHDHHVLPDLIDDLDLAGVDLLGAGGTWERQTITRDGDPLVHVDGWSFPDSHVLYSPLDDYDLPETTDAPTLGVVHADLDAPGSDYAPVTTAGLAETTVNAWLLGHIHVAGVRNEADPLVLYPGSPQGLDPGERGQHGSWTLNMTGRPDTTVEATPCPLAAVQYDQVEVDEGDVTAVRGLSPLLSEAASEYVREQVDTNAVDVVLLRVKLTGRTPAHSDLHTRPDQLLEFRTRENGVVVAVEDIVVDTRPDFDLDDLATGETPVAYLADILTAIDEGRVHDDYGELVADTTAAL
jgi:DNA repair exonuclease SbcCD nuclease subunit